MLRELGWRLVVPVVLAIATLIVVLVCLRPRISAWRQQRREAYLASEAYAYKLAGAALRQQHFGHAINAIYTWRSRLPRACRSRFDDIGSILLPLSAMLYRRERQQPAAGHWDQANDALSDARRTCRAVSKETMRSRLLPPLNPVPGAPYVLQKLNRH